MRFTRILLPLAVFLLVGFVGAQGVVPAPDGMPDISGRWVGQLRVKTWDQHPNADDQGRGKAPIQLDILQNGADVTITLSVPTDEGTRQFVMPGKIGHGVFWGLQNKTREIFMIWGRVRGKKLKGFLVLIDDFTVAEAKFTVKRGPGEAKTGVTSTITGFADGLPSVDGDWSGTHRWKGYRHYDPGPGEKDKGRGKDSIAISFSQSGGSITADYTVFSDEGPEVVPMTGEHGNGHLWLLGTHPQSGGPVFFIGHVKKRPIKGKGVAILEEGVFEFKFTVKRPK
jgi:hypothetical protein